MSTSPADGGLHEPLPPALRRALRRAVLDHALAERRRVHRPILHLGTPGGPDVLFSLRPGERADTALRSDLVAALLVRAGGHHGTPLVWLTRSGGLEPEDEDQLWLAGAAAACAEAGRTLVFVVVNRHGWRDPRSGLSRSWVRLRRR